MKIIFQICLLVVFLLTASEIAYSCSCFRIGNKDEIEITDVIFTGEAVEIIEDTTYVPPKIENVSSAVQERVDSRKRYLVKFKVDEGFKNADRREITLVGYEQEAIISCPGVIFRRGNKYLVYASEAGGELQDGGICSRTQNFHKKSRDYKELLEYRLKSKNKRLS